MEQRTHDRDMLSITSCKWSDGEERAMITVRYGVPTISTIGSFLVTAMDSMRRINPGFDFHQKIKSKHGGIGGSSLSNLVSDNLVGPSACLKQRFSFKKARQS